MRKPQIIRLANNLGHNSLNTTVEKRENWMDKTASKQLLRLCQVSCNIVVKNDNISVIGHRG